MSVEQSKINKRLGGAPTSTMNFLNGLSADIGKEKFSQFENTPGGFFVYYADEEEKMIYANDEMLNIFECDTVEEFMTVTKGSFKGLVMEEDLDFVEESIYDQIGGRDNSFDQIYYRIRTKNGNIRYVEDYGKYVYDEDLGHLFYVFLSFKRTVHDSLTGLMEMNYVLARDRDMIHNLVAEGKKIDCLAFEINGIKDIDIYFGQARRELLRGIAQILLEHFGKNNVFKFGKDNFYAYVVDSPELESHLNSIIIEFNKLVSDRTLILLIGIYDGLDEHMEIETALERAHLACTLNRDSYRSYFFRLNDKDIQSDLIREYIIRNIDRAIEEGWIVPYFQPVIRSLTGRTCSGEALARWMDPNYGMLSPAVFIPVLEEAEISYKLDMYMVRKCVEILKQRMDVGELVWPASINLSASDFVACDPVSMIVSLMDAFSIPRHLICVEITESTVMKDKDRIHDAIRRFHESGIQVWMDDFGSGYSSLNVLKDFDFDLIKIDMLFLRNFDERSKTIIKSTVSMAKKIGLHTLAEGVETVEQAEFLKDIGCERLQGFYFGKPLSASDSLKNLEHKMLEPEDLETATFYEKVGRVDLISDYLATALFLDDGKKFVPVYMNSNYKYVLSRTGIDPNDVVDINMNASESPNGKKFRNLANKAKETLRPERMTFVVRDHYYHYSFRFIAAGRAGSMLLAHIDDKEYGDNKKLSELDGLIRNIVSAFDRIYLVDSTEHTRTVIITDDKYERVGDVISNSDITFERFIRKVLHIDDYDRFKTFLDGEYVARMLKKTGRGSYSDIFRIKKSDGSYEWKEFMVVALPETEAKKVLVAIRTASVEDQEDRQKAALRIADISEYIGFSFDLFANLWRSLMQNTDIKFFWKDRDRRFRGASRSFLEYYSYKSLDTIVGKTDEDLGMNVDDEVFRRNEMIVLDEGKIVNTRGLNIVDGNIRPIFATKMPYYKGNKIDGLIGYFIDVGLDYDRRNRILNESIVDPESGLATARGLVIALTDLDDNYHQNSEDFTEIAVKIGGVEKARTEYGNDVVHKLRNLVVSRMRLIYGSKATIGKLPGTLAVCMKRIPEEQLLEMNRRCIKEIESIRDMDEYRFTLRVELGYAHRSEVSSVMAIIDKVMGRVGKSNSRSSAEAVIPDPYSDLPVPYVVVKPVKDAKGIVHDASFLYANLKFCSFSGKSPDELIGHYYKECFKNTSIEWSEYVDKAMRGEYVHERVFSIEIGLWVEFIISKFSMPGCYLLLFTKIG